MLIRVEHDLTDWHNLHLFSSRSSSVRCSLSERIGRPAARSSAHSDVVDSSAHRDARAWIRHSVSVFCCAIRTCKRRAEQLKTSKGSQCKAGASGRS